MFYIYILQSLKNGRFYIGYSECPDRRLDEHNSGKVIATRAHRPWQKVYEEIFPNEREAIARERYLKSMKSRSFLIALIAKQSNG